MLSWYHRIFSLSWPGPRQGWKPSYKTCSSSEEWYAKNPMSRDTSPGSSELGLYSSSDNLLMSSKADKTSTGIKVSELAPPVIYIGRTKTTSRWSIANRKIFLEDSDLCSSWFMESVVSQTPRHHFQESVHSQTTRHHFQESVHSQTPRLTGLVQSWVTIF